VIVLDAAHGGSDIGAQISEHVLEKDVTLALAVKLRSLLAARGFAVVLTRDSDTAISTDQRAEAANRAHAVACLVLHATASGSGVHLATSALNAVDTTAAGAPVPWDNAQAAYLTQSQKLAAGIGDAVTRSQVPLVAAKAWMKPLDNLTCAAVSVEIAPLGRGSDATAVNDQWYQQRVSEAVAGALILWRNQAGARSAVAAPGIGRGVDAGARP